MIYVMSQHLDASQQLQILDIFFKYGVFSKN